MKLSIRWDETLAPVSRRVLGHNSVWSRGGLGLWNEETRSLRPEVVALVAGLRPGVLRWPGGTRAMKHHFDETIGPYEARTPQCDTFTGRLDGTTWGMDEFLRFAAGLGAETTLVTPWLDGTPERAAAMVAYANARPDSTVILGTDASGRDWGTAGEWAARRVANGQGEPYRVPFLEVGNEQYLTIQPGSKICGTSRLFTQAERIQNGAYVPSTARDVAEQVVRTARLVKRVDPEILVGAPALSDVLGMPVDPATAIGQVDKLAGTGDAWNPTLLAVAGDDFDFWVVHTYSFTMHPERVRLADELRHTVERLRSLGGRQRFAVTEYGTLFDSGGHLNAIITADIIRVAVEERLLMSLRHILIEDRPSGLFATSAAILGPEHQLMPGYHAMAWLAAALRPVAVPVSTGDPEVVALVTRGAQSLGILLVDRRLGGSELSVEVPLPPGRWRGRASIMSAAELTSRAEECTHTHTELTAAGSLVVSLPLHGVAVLDLSE